VPDRANGHAFGLDVRAPFALPGLAPGGTGNRPVDVALAAPAELESLVPAATAERISDNPPLSIDTARGQGYLFRTAAYGTHWISAAGDRILCAPPEGAEEWFWQRMLIGQLFPFAALLRGLEVFHASAVVLDGRAIALVAASGTGKTSVAAELTLGPAEFLADDVVALEAAGDGLIAHPGAGLANVRRSAGADLVARVAGAGRVEGGDETAVRIAIEPYPEAVPLGALCILTRAPDAPALRVARPEPVDPRILLASTFNFVLQSPERQTQLLDVCARAARGVVLHGELPPDSNPATTAAAVLEAVRSTWA
jgi:hypothetical protein